MSQYLVDRISALRNVELHIGKEVAALDGDARGLTSVSWLDRRTGETTDCPTRFLFMFIGADPNTDWMGECEAARDRLGFVLTGEGISDGDLRTAGWPLERRPKPLETSIPGVFAIGDARAGSVKRVAAAVGEGAAVVAQLHAFFAEQGDEEQSMLLGAQQPPEAVSSDQALARELL
jgi:thioredoxin reductase (NADPH)